MAISLHACGSWAYAASGSVTPTLPTHSAGDMLLVRVAYKSSAIASCLASTSTPGWGKVGEYHDGTVNSGNGLGSVAVAVFWKEAASGAETNPTIDFSQTVTQVGVVALSYSKGGSEAWVTPVGDGGPDEVVDASKSMTIQSHVAVAAGDMVDFFLGIRDDTVMTLPSISQTGVTFGTVSEQPAAAGTDTSGADGAYDGGYRLASSGTSSAAAVVVGTLNSNETGSAWMTRLRVGLPATTLTPSPAATTPNGQTHTLGRIKSLAAAALALTLAIPTPTLQVIGPTKTIAPTLLGIPKIYGQPRSTQDPKPVLTPLPLTYPTAHAESSVAPETGAWTTPENALAPDGLTAQYQPGGGGTSQRLRLSGFGFAVPDGVTVVGVIAEVYGQENIPEADVVDYRVQLGDASAPFGDNKASPTEWPTDMTLRAYGGPSDDWGASLTPAIVNSADFSLYLSVTKVGGVFRVDFVRVGVFYVIEIAPDPAVASLAVPPPTLTVIPPPTVLSPDAVAASAATPVPLVGLILRPDPVAAALATGEPGAVHGDPDIWVGRTDDFYPTIVTVVVGDGTLDWTDWDDGLMPDARIVPSATGTGKTKWLTGQNWANLLGGGALSIAGAFIFDGIEVHLFGRASADVSDAIVQWYNGSVLIGDNKASAEPWSATNALRVYGGPSDTWGRPDYDKNLNLALSFTLAGGDIHIEFARVMVWGHFAPAPLPLVAAARFGLPGSIPAWIARPGVGWPRSLVTRAVAPEDDFSWSYGTQTTLCPDGSLIASGVGTGISRFLVAYNHGVDGATALRVPVNAVIDGITVDLRCRGTADIADDIVQLGSSNNVRIGESRARPADPWDATDFAIRTYGGPSDTWGATLTPAIINSSGFSVWLSVSASAGTAYVEYARVTVHWHTAVPDPVAATTAVPVPTLDRVKTLSPDAVAASLAVPAPTIGVAGAPQTLTPDAVAASGAVPVPTLDRLRATTPAATATTAAIPVPTLDRALAAQPDATGASLAVPVPTVERVRTAAPDPAASQPAAPVPTIGLAYTLAPSPIAASLATPAPTIGVTGAPREVAPDAVAATTQAPTPTLDRVRTATPAPVATTPSVPEPSIGLVTTLGPTPAAVTLAAPATTLGRLLSIGPAAVAASPSVPQPTIERSKAIAPSPMAAALAIPQPSVVPLGPGINILPPATVATAGVPTPALVRSREAAPAAAPLTLAVPVPTITHDKALAPAAVAASLIVPTVRFVFRPRGSTTVRARGTVSSRDRGSTTPR